MGHLGFEFKRIERNEYLLNAVKKAVAHPVSVYHLWNTFKTTGEYPELGKISSGINISISQELVVGLFFKRKEI